MSEVERELLQELRRILGRLEELQRGQTKAFQHIASLYRILFGLLAMAMALAGYMVKS
jgi:hypothetical protein